MQVTTDYMKSTMFLSSTHSKGLVQDAQAGARAAQEAQRLRYQQQMLHAAQQRMEAGRASMDAARAGQQPGPAAAAAGPSMQGECILHVGPHPQLLPLLLPQPACQARAWEGAQQH